MTPEEALYLCRLAKAMCPQQALDEFTPEAWHLLLDDLRLEDAKDALVMVCRTQPFVSASEVRAGVKAIRRNRLLKFGPIPIPDGLESSGYFDYMLEAQTKIADGAITDPEELVPIGELIERDMTVIPLVRSVDDA